MSARGLLSRLGADLAGAASAQVDPAASIMEHLRVLLNTRRGESASAPSFGVIDFNDFVHSLPSSVQALQAAIRATILEYEPRLKNVTVRHIADEDPLVLRFEITAQPAHRGGRGTLRFQTQVRPGGQFDINWQAPGV